MSSNRFEEVAIALEHASEMAIAYVRSLEQRPAGTTVTADELFRAFDEPLPEDGMEPTAVLDEWWRRAEPGVVASSGPRFFGFVLGGSTPAAAAGDTLAVTLDQVESMWVGSPAAVHTEVAVIEWLKELFGLPKAWHGIVTNGATMSNLAGLAAGRQWAGERLGFDPAADGLGGHPPIPVISSTEIHASDLKALATLGLGRKSLTLLPANEGAVDLNALEQGLAAIDGPAIVVANVSEVNTGAFDDLASIVERCEAHPAGVWIHADAAFGLFAALSERTAHYLSGIDRCQSVCVDGHKWLNVPYDSAFTFVQDRDLLVRSFSTTAAYLEPQPGSGPDPMFLNPNYSTRFRSLAAWCALKAWGRRGYREMVERCLDNAAAFATWIDSTAGVELLAPAPLNIVCWRYVPAGLSESEIDDFNRKAVVAIQKDGRVFVSPTVWNRHYGIRCAFDHWATNAEDVGILESTIEDVGRSIFSQATARSKRNE